MTKFFFTLLSIGFASLLLSGCALLEPLPGDTQGRAGGGEVGVGLGDGGLDGHNRENSRNATESGHI